MYSNWVYKAKIIFKDKVMTSMFHQMATRPYFIVHVILLANVHSPSPALYLPKQILIMQQKAESQLINT